MATDQPQTSVDADAPAMNATDPPETVIDDGGPASDMSVRMKIAKDLLMQFRFAGRVTCGELDQIAKRCFIIADTLIAASRLQEVTDDGETQTEETAHGPLAAGACR